MTPLIHIHAMSKSYGGVQALSNVSMEIARGEVHALCGENGAGKSTLIKILSGSVNPDEGAIQIAAPNASSGSSVSFLDLKLGDVRASESAGIAVIHQESVAFPHLSTYDNIFVGRERKLLFGFFLDRRKMRTETRSLLTRLGEGDAFDPARPVGELSVAQCQMVGMARALSHDCRVLIMDEPTASLSERETRTLFHLIRQFRQQGVGILYVSHRLDEVFELADRVTVLRDGKHVSTDSVKNLTREKLIHQMVGRELLQVDRESQSPGLRPGSSPILQIRNLARKGSFENISFNLHAGEILAMAGLVGAGRSEVARVIFGADPRDAGEVLLDGKPLAGNSVRQAMNAGIAMVPEDRQHLGLVLQLPVATNLSLAVLRTLTTFGLTSSARERQLAQKLMQQLAVKAPSSKVPAQTLSGGNQQKLVIGKWLATKPRVLILDEPTRGVDVGAKAEVHKLIRQLASQGMATLLISSDLPEVLAMSDRILVMRAGSIAGELSRDQASQESILSLALHSTEGAAA